MNNLHRLNFLTKQTIPRTGSLARTEKLVFSFKSNRSTKKKFDIKENKQQRH